MQGHYWAVHPANVDDFTKGDFRRRRAQRKVRKHMGLSVPDDDDDSPSPSPNPFPWPQQHDKDAADSDNNNTQLAAEAKGEGGGVGGGRDRLLIASFKDSMVFVSGLLFHKLTFVPPWTTYVQYQSGTPGILLVHKKSRLTHTATS